MLPELTGLFEGLLGFNGRGVGIQDSGVRVSDIEKSKSPVAETILPSLSFNCNDNSTLAGLLSIIIEVKYGL